MVTIRINYLLSEECQKEALLAGVKLAREQTVDVAPTKEIVAIARIEGNGDASIDATRGDRYGGGPTRYSAVLLTEETAGAWVLADRAALAAERASKKQADKDHELEFWRKQSEAIVSDPAGAACIQGDVVASKHQAIGYSDLKNPDRACSGDRFSQLSPEAQAIARARVAELLLQVRATTEAREKAAADAKSRMTAYVIASVPKYERAAREGRDVCAVGRQCAIAAILDALGKDDHVENYKERPCHAPSDYAYATLDALQDRVIGVFHAFSPELKALVSVPTFEIVRGDIAPGKDDEDWHVLAQACFEVAGEKVEYNVDAEPSETVAVV